MNNCKVSLKAIKEEKLIPEYLQELFENSTALLNKQEAEQLSTLFIQFKEVFAKDSGDLGRTTVVEDTINTRNANPLKQRPRSIPFKAFKDEEDKEIKKC